MFSAILAWLKSKKTFLKVQSGTGDNLLKEDIREGYVDYCLWSTNAWTAAWSCSGKTAPPERRWNRATGKPSAPTSTRTTSYNSCHPERTLEP